MEVEMEEAIKGSLLEEMEAAATKQRPETKAKLGYFSMSESGSAKKLEGGNKKVDCFHITDVNTRVNTLVKPNYNKLSGVSLANC